MLADSVEGVAQFVSGSYAFPNAFNNTLIAFSIVDNDVTLILIDEAFNESYASSRNSNNLCLGIARISLCLRRRSQQTETCRVYISLP